MLQPTICSIFQQFPAASWSARHIYNQEITVSKMMKTCKKEQLVLLLQNLPYLKKTSLCLWQAASSSTLSKSKVSTSARFLYFFFLNWYMAYLHWDKRWKIVFLTQHIQRSILEREENRNIFSRFPSYSLSLAVTSSVLH